jgi:hypothetical protein
MQCQGTTSPRAQLLGRFAVFKHVAVATESGEAQDAEWIGFFQRSGPMDLHMFAFDPVRTYPDTT